MSNAKLGPSGPDRPAELPLARLPKLLVMSAVLVAGQGLFFVAYALLELLHLSTSRLALGVTTSIFFATYGGLLLACAYAFTRTEAWARSPVVLAQFITLLVAWGFRGGATTVIAVGVATIALTTLVGVFAPASAEAMAENRSRQV